MRRRACAASAGDRCRTTSSTTATSADFGRAQILFGAQSLRGCAQRVSGHQRPGQWRRSGAGRSPHRRERLLPEALCRHPRRADAVSRSRVASGRSALLLPERDSRARRCSDQYVSLTRALVNDFPDSTWSEDALNNLGTYYIVSNAGRARGAGVQGVLRAVSGRPARAADGVEVRLVGVQDRQLRGDRSRLRGRCRQLPPLGLSPVVPVLGGARARSDWGSARPRSRGCGSFTPTT